MSEALKNHPYAKTIWDTLLAEIGNKYGVAALMGNLQAESGLYPDRVQGDVPYSSYSQEYTADVDSGVISEYDFVYNGPNGGGYGLAQWTYYTRKQKLYDLWQSNKSYYKSIGSVQLALDYLILELQTSFKDVWDTLKETPNIRIASNMVLHDFEAPADQSSAVEDLRESMGQEIYNTFASGSSGGGGDSGDDDEGGGTIRNSHMSKLLLYAIATDII
ncbi:MAG: hypothetical protein J6S23_01260 [Clostridia bacterium]|nr:hypothetical protein [Clostridia bacterium]